MADLPLLLPAKYRRRSPAHPLSPFEIGAVLAMLSMAMTQTDIALRIGCTAQTVHATIERSRRPVEADEDPEAPDSLTEHLKDYLCLLTVRHNDANPAQLYRKLEEDRPELARLITAKDKAGAIRRLLLRIVSYRRATARPPLTDTQKSTRYRWLLDFDRSTYDNVVWSDEMMIARTGSAYRWITNEEDRYSAIRIAPSEKIMVWGALSVAGGPMGPLVIWPAGTMVTAERYKADVLSAQVGPWWEQLSPDKRQAYVFQQDGARVHWTASCRGWAMAKGVRLLPDWPAHSPDLSLIELVWARVKAIVNATDPSVPLRDALQSAWIEATKPESIQKMKADIMANWDRTIDDAGDNRHRTA